MLTQEKRERIERLIAIARRAVRVQRYEAEQIAPRNPDGLKAIAEAEADHEIVEWAAIELLPAPRTVREHRTFQVTKTADRGSRYRPTNGTCWVHYEFLRENESPIQHSFSNFTNDIAHAGNWMKGAIMSDGTLEYVCTVPDPRVTSYGD